MCRITPGLFPERRSSWRRGWRSESQASHLGSILYLLAQPLLDLASDHLMRDRDLTMRYEERFEVEGSDEWTAAMAEYNREADAITAALFRAQGEAGLAHLYLTDRRSVDRRMERGRQHFFGPPTGAHAAYLRSKGIID